MIFFLLTALYSLDIPYVPGGYPQAVTADGQVIFTVPQNRGGEPTLVIGDTTILTYGSGPNEGQPLRVTYDEMSRTAIVQGYSRHYQLEIFSKVESKADYDLLPIRRGGKRKILQTKFGLSEIHREMKKSFEWTCSDGEDEQLIYRMAPSRYYIPSFVFTGTQAFVIVDNHTKEAIVHKLGVGSAKVALDPFDLFPINYHSRRFKAYSKGFSFIEKGKEYYAVTSSAGHLVVFSINGEVIRTHTRFNNEDGKVHLTSDEELDFVQAIGAFEGMIILADFDDATFRYYPVDQLLSAFNE